MTSTTFRKLTLVDIADVRAYEREREAVRAEVIETKRDYLEVVELLDSTRDELLGDLRH